MYFQLRVSSMGEKTLFVSLTCSQAREAMVKICEVFESLKLKIITASVTSVSGMFKKTILIEVRLFFPSRLSIISLQGTEMLSNKKWLPKIHVNVDTEMFFFDSLSSSKDVRTINAHEMK
jgi:hypothetical protein